MVYFWGSKLIQGLRKTLLHKGFHWVVPRCGHNTSHSRDWTSIKTNINIQSLCFKVSLIFCIFPKLKFHAKYPKLIVLWQVLVTAWYYIPGDQFQCKTFNTCNFANSFIDCQSIIEVWCQCKTLRSATLYRCS